MRKRLGMMTSDTLDMRVPVDNAHRWVGKLILALQRVSHRSTGSPISIVTTGWTTAVRFPATRGTFFRHRVQTGWHTQPPIIQWVPAVKRSVREAEHSPPSSAKVKE
jgi:hypothetical protein